MDNPVTQPTIGGALRWEAWMQLEDPDMTVEEAVKILSDLGNAILEVDVPGRRVKVLDVTTDHP